MEHLPSRRVWQDEGVCEEHEARWSYCRRRTPGFDWAVRRYKGTFVVFCSDDESIQGYLHAGMDIQNDCMT